MTARSLALLNDLLGRLYDGVMTSEGFQSFIEALRELFQLKGVSLMVRHAETQEIRGIWLCGISQSEIESYVLEYADEDMLAQHIMRSPVAHFYASNLDVPHPERIPESRFYKEWVIPQGMAYAAGAIVLQEGPWSTLLFVQKAPSHPPFVRAEMEELNLLIPHLQRAIQMRQRFTELQLGQNFLIAGLDVLAMPTFLLAEDGLVVHHNRSATTMLATLPDIRIDQGHLQTNDRTTNRKLNWEIAQAVRTRLDHRNEMNGVVLMPRSGHQPLMLMITPLPLPEPSTVRGAALMFAFNPEATPRATLDLVRRLFTLSNAEAELAVALCSGKALDDVVEDRGTSINTVKSQLKNIFLKTGTKRQSELVALLLSSPAYFLATEYPALPAQAILAAGF